MPYHVSSFCPQSEALAPNLEHWRRVAWEIRSTSDSFHHHSVNWRPHTPF